MVEHDMDLVMGVCDEIHVLDFGAVIASGPPARVRTDPRSSRPTSATPTSDAGDARPATRPPPGRRSTHMSVPAVEPSRASIPILEVVDLHAAYGRIEVLRGVDLTIPRGAVMALLGPNGAGKSTLIKVISGQKAATGGHVHLGGVNVHDADPRSWPGSGCARCPRDARSSRTSRSRRTSADVVRRRLGRRGPRDRVRLLPAAARAPQAARGHDVRRRAADARHVAGAGLRPGPADARRAVDGLAPLIVDELYDTVAQIAESGVSILCIEQFARTALRVSDYAAVMSGGRIVATGEPEEIMATMSDVILGGAA